MSQRGSIRELFAQLQKNEEAFRLDVVSKIEHLIRLQLQILEAANLAPVFPTKTSVDISDGPTKDEIQLEELQSQAISFTMVSDSLSAETRLQKAYIIGTSSGHYPEESYVRNGHLFFGFLHEDKTTQYNWLVHDPDCPKCLAR